QYRQAQALVGSARADAFPSVNASSGATRAGGGSSSGAGGTSSQYNLSGSVSWEIDLWGKVSRSVQAGEAGAQASAADLANTRLSMQSTLAQTYFRLRSADAE